MFQQARPAVMFFIGDIKGRLRAHVKARGAQFTMPPTEVTGSTIAQLNDTCGTSFKITQLAHWS